MTLQRYGIIKQGMFWWCLWRCFGDALGMLWGCFGNLNWRMLRSDQHSTWNRRWWRWKCETWAMISGRLPPVRQGVDNVVWSPSLEIDVRIPLSGFFPEILLPPPSLPPIPPSSLPFPLLTGHDRNMILDTWAFSRKRRWCVAQLLIEAFEILLMILGILWSCWIVVAAVVGSMFDFLLLLLQEGGWRGREGRKGGRVGGVSE